MRGAFAVCSRFSVFANPRFLRTACSRWRRESVAPHDSSLVSETGPLPLREKGRGGKRAILTKLVYYTHPGGERGRFYGLLVAMTFWRLSLWQDGRNVSWLYLISVAIVALVMTVQGYLGGELVYRYGLEVEQRYRQLPERQAESTPPPLVPQPATRVTVIDEKRGEAG